MNLSTYAVTTCKGETWQGLAENARAAVAHAEARFLCPKRAIVNVTKRQWNGRDNTHERATVLYDAKRNGLYHAETLAEDW